MGTGGDYFFAPSFVTPAKAGVHYGLSANDGVGGTAQMDSRLRGNDVKEAGKVVSPRLRLPDQPVNLHPEARAQAFHVALRQKSAKQRLLPGAAFMHAFQHGSRLIGAQRAPQGTLARLVLFVLGHGWKWSRALELL